MKPNERNRESLPENLSDKITNHRVETPTAGLRHEPPVRDVKFREGEEMYDVIWVF
ncbi:hypothetical protein HanIR_Chr03g0108901 [Helianthus annuus]|nr:hypothetical protein HanIR_Chr03g0108901 [Helianthus annuus]